MCVWMNGETDGNKCMEKCELYVFTGEYEGTLETWKEKRYASVSRVALSGEYVCVCVCVCVCV